MMWTNEQTQRFEHGLRKQGALYRGLLQCTLGHRAGLSDAGDPADLSAMLAEKQRWMTNIDQLEKELEPHKRTWPLARANVPPALGAAVEERLQELQVLLRELISAEEQAASILRSRMEGGRGALGEVTRRHSGARAYALSGANASRFIDNVK